MAKQPTPASAPDGANAPGGVIHDIGFRHYDGKRLGRGWIVRSLILDTYRGVFGLGRPTKAKIMPWILIGILMVPPLVSLLIAVITGQQELVVGYTDYLAGMGIVISLFVAARAPQAVSRDLRYGVMPLYLSRPLRRTDYVWAKLAGFAAALLSVMAAGEVLLLVGALLAELPVGDQFEGFAYGMAVAVMLTAVLSVIGLVIAAFTPRRGLGIAAIITVFVVLTGVAAVAGEVLLQAGQPTIAVYASAIDPYVLVDALAVTWFDVPAAFGIGNEVGAVEATAYTAALVAVVAGGIAVLMSRYQKVGVA